LRAHITALTDSTMPMKVPPRCPVGSPVHPGRA
jgi:hypothetical protein